MIPVGPATLPTCRSGLPVKVFPSSDSLICNPSASIGSNHLMVAVGAQNYGQNSYRIRQPFDFAGRTGKIVLDADGAMDALLGWLSVAVTEDPAPVPGYSIGSPGQTNDEGGASPRSGFIVVFAGCNHNLDQFAVRFIDVFRSYQDTLHTPTNQVCVSASEGHLNHIELRVSQSRIEIYATPYSADGVSFAASTLLYGADVNLPFSRGYVQLTVHNHATLKYSSRDAWITRFDNVGFDGPVIDASREYEIPDSLVSGSNAFSIAGPVMSVGYRVRDAADGPGQTLAFEGVDLNGVTSARLSVATWYLNLPGDPAVANYVLKYRLNNGTWRLRPLSAEELALLTNGHQWGQLGQMINVPVSDLVSGRNTLEFVTENVSQNYPPSVSSIDLILQTQ